MSPCLGEYQGLSCRQCSFCNGVVCLMLKRPHPCQSIPPCQHLTLAEGGAQCRIRSSFRSVVPGDIKAREKQKLGVSIQEVVVVRVRHPCQSRFFRQHLTCEDWCPVPLINKRFGEVVSDVRPVDSMKTSLRAAYMLPMLTNASMAAFSSGV